MNDRFRKSFYVDIVQSTRKTCDEGKIVGILLYESKGVSVNQLSSDHSFFHQ